MGVGEGFKKENYDYSASLVLKAGLLVGRGKKSQFSGTNSRKKRPISREFRGNFRGQFH